MSIPKRFSVTAYVRAHLYTVVHVYEKGNYAMANTEFSVFAQKLGITFRGDSSPEEFSKALFEAIYLPTTEVNPVDELLPRSYKGYFYGHRDITTLARKISNSLDTAAFASSYSTETDASLQALCEAFAEDCKGINVDNCSDMIAARFQRIILNAAATKQKIKKTSTEKTVESFSEVSGLSLKDRHGIFLVTEAGNCPNDGCTRSLYIRNNGCLEMAYEVVIIDPTLPEDSIGNLIALCPACAARYNIGKTQDTMQRMKYIKKALVDNYEAHEITADQTVQDGIRFVIERIPKIPKPADVDLNYNPVPVRRKIDASNDMLYAKAQNHVNVYYPAVNDAFLDLGAEGKLRFDPFCRQVRNTYLGLKEQGYDQDTIYFEMTKWLRDATNGNWSACEIVISYFIQKCEVFDVIPE